jgi:hypothetical protein
MAGTLVVSAKLVAAGAVRPASRVTTAKPTVDSACPSPTVQQRTSLTPSSLIFASWVWRFYALQLVDEFANASGYMLVERAGSDGREDA